MYSTALFTLATSVQSDLYSTNPLWLNSHVMLGSPPKAWWHAPSRLSTMIGRVIPRSSRSAQACVSFCSMLSSGGKFSPGCASPVYRKYDPTLWSAKSSASWFIDGPAIVQ